MRRVSRAASAITAGAFVVAALLAPLGGLDARELFSIGLGTVGVGMVLR